MKDDLYQRDDLSTEPGTVFLVGAGPGDPDLLTVKALKLLYAADVVVHDRLVSPEVMALVPSTTPRLYVGKESGRHPCPQHRINQMLLDCALSHRTVVRLKGGDPFVFGRGGEEAEFLTTRGIEVEIVPGITSAAACGAVCGVPLTHRGLATGVRFVTGHARDDRALDLNWASLADASTTLVVYMGLGTLPQIAARLMDHGLPGSTPFLAVENATTPQERRLLTTLHEAPLRVAAAGFVPPTLFVIGQVAAMARLPMLEAAPRAVPVHA